VCVCVCVYSIYSIYIYIYIYIYIKVKWSRYRLSLAQRVARGTALRFHDRGTRRGWVVNSTPRPHFTPGKDPVPILQEAGWVPGPVWTGGKSRPHRDSIMDRPAVVCRYTDWATRPTHTHTHVYIYIYIYVWVHKNRKYLSDSFFLLIYCDELGAIDFWQEISSSC